jgi:hypothetical protein
MKIQLDSVYVPSEDIVARKIEGELVIVPLISGIGDTDDELYTLNETGQAIWDLLDGKNSIQDIIKKLTTEYDASDEEVKQDILGLVKELVSRRILVEKTI